jgi:exodeoxyribonuclease VII large subunit
MSNPASRDLLFDEARAPRATVLPVSLFVSSARLIVERHLGLVWISGEVSNFSRAASGHCYFVLKDDQAQVRCVMYRQKAQLLRLTLQDGEQVEVRATPTIYEARGEFQLTVETVRRSGFGALYERFARLKARLEEAGWFAPSRKRDLPGFPRAIGIVTSPRAAALFDVLATLKRRMPSVPVILYPASVQGEGAAKEIAAAIAAANAHAKVDVLIVCRGGGSIEDLWAFNEEIVARAVLESRLPIVSGVGHESDFTICDFVADARAPTPTAAAAMAAPARTELWSQLLTTSGRWARALERALERRMQRLDVASRRLVHPAARLAQQRGRLERAALRWQRATAARIENLAQRLSRLEAGLKHLSPQNVLDRGYSIVTTASGAIVQDVAQVAIGAEVELTFARGAAGALITKTKNG